MDPTLIAIIVLALGLALGYFLGPVSYTHLTLPTKA